VLFDHVAIRGVQVATASASDDRASLAGSVAAGAATPAGRSPVGTLARLGDGNAASAAETGSNPLPLDPDTTPNIPPPFALPHATSDRRPDWQARDADQHPRQAWETFGAQVLKMASDLAKSYYAFFGIVREVLEEPKLCSESKR
jgi:hypothetical protein